MAKLVTFGEIMMRLSPPGKKRFRQTESFDVIYGGSEANVSAALAAWGQKSMHVTAFPDNEIGCAASGYFTAFEVDMTACLFKSERLGIYFVENGAMARSAHVVYDRGHSSFASINENSFDWERILAGASWFHWTGITPALSEGAAKSLAKALDVAVAKGLTVSADINYRANLWQWGAPPQAVMPALIGKSNIVVASENDTKNSCGIIAAENEDAFESVSRQLTERFPSIAATLTTEREQISASQNRLYARMYRKGFLYQTPVYELANIVERIGSGDAFMAGFIFGGLQGYAWEDCLQYGVASAVVKHSIEGDINCCRIEDVRQVMEGNTSGRMKR